MRILNVTTHHWHALVLRLSHRWRRWVSLRVYFIRVSHFVCHAKASYKPWSSLQNLSMSSYYRSMNSSRRSTVRFLPQHTQWWCTRPTHVSFLRLPSAELLKKEKIIVDCKVYMFAMGMAQAFFKPRELPVLKQWRRTEARDRLRCCTRVSEI